MLGTGKSTGKHDISHMTKDAETDHLADVAAYVLEQAKKHGADAADAIIVEGWSINAGCRMGKWEDIERSEARDMGLRVFIGHSQANVSTTDFGRDHLDEMAARAVAMAKVTPEDPYCGLADPARLATEWPDLDVFDATEPSTEELRELAKAAEEAAWAVDGITNSLGSEANAGAGGMVLVTSDGFQGTYRNSSFTLSCAVVAGEGTAMERDYDYTSMRHFADLEAAGDIGRKAAERTVARLNPQKVSSQAVPVVFDPRVSGSLVSHLSSAISGAAIARGTSFLKDHMGEKIFADGITIIDDPHRPRGRRSKPFDAEGVVNGEAVMVDNGVLQSWLLDSRSARQLGLETTGHAGRGTSSPPSPSITNFYMKAGTISRDDLIGGVAEGFYVTDLIGRGGDVVTGDYSRGAAGFWIENGEITHAVSEVTIAGNLKDMYLNLTPADDLEFRYGTDAPTVLVEGMTLAGT